MERGKASFSVEVVRNRPLNNHKTTIRFVEDGVELKSKSPPRPAARHIHPSTRTHKPFISTHSRPNASLNPSEELEQFLPASLRPPPQRLWKYRGSSHSIVRKNVFDSSEIALWSIRNKSPGK